MSGTGVRLVAKRVFAFGGIRTEQENPMQKVIIKCWEDEAFKERLLADPAATLAAEEGVQVPEGVTVKVAVVTADVRAPLISPLPSAELRDEELAGIAAGAGHIEEVLGHSAQ